MLLQEMVYTPLVRVVLNTPPPHISVFILGGKPYLGRCIKGRSIYLCLDAESGECGVDFTSKSPAFGPGGGWHRGRIASNRYIPTPSTYPHVYKG